MKTTEVIANAGMRIVPKAKNIFRVGWHNGYMVVEFRRGDALWIYGPDVDSGEMDKILRVPFPDNQFTKAVKNKFKAFKVGPTPTPCVQKPKES